MILDTDVRQVLPSVRVSTLVVHRIGDRATSGSKAAAISPANIAGAKFVEVPGADHFPWVGDTDAILDEVEQFVTGVRRGAEPDRILATVLFTDIVDSTELAAIRAIVGWRALLDAVLRHVSARLAPTPRPRDQHHRRRPSSPPSTVRLAPYAARTARDAAALGIAMRAGLHTGECEIRATRSAASPSTWEPAWRGKPTEVLVTSTVKDLVAGSWDSVCRSGSSCAQRCPGRMAPVRCRALSPGLTWRWTGRAHERDSSLRMVVRAPVNTGSVRRRGGRRQ